MSPRPILHVPERQCAIAPAGGYAVWCARPGHGEIEMGRFATRAPALRYADRLRASGAVSVNVKLTTDQGGSYAP